MLDEFRARDLRPGDNLKGGRSADPSWMFLLPSLRWSRVAVLGTPPAGAVELIRRLSPDVELVSEVDRAQLVLVTDGVRRRPGRPASPGAIGTLSPSTPAVLFNLERNHQADQNELLGSLSDSRPIGSVTALTTKPTDAVRPTPPPEGRASVVLPHGPEPASPARDWAARTAKGLAKRADAASGGLVSRIRSTIGRPPGGSGPDISMLYPGGTAGRGKTAIVLPDGTDPHDPPDWLVSTARRHAVDLTGDHWAIAPPRGYRSQKVVFFFRSTGDGPPQVVVKLTQDPAFNGRLDNEVRLLRAVADLPGPPCLVPKVVFSDTVAGLSMVAETALNGRPFRQRSSGQPDCGFVADALESITRLGVSSRTPVEGSGWQVMMDLVEDYIRLYQPDPQEASLLAGCATALLERADDLPAVIQHGDPGVWNLLVTDEGTVGFLDWENGELRGAPLWDLFVFIKTLGAWSARSDGTRYGPEVFEQQLLGDSPYRQLLDRQATSYCRAVGIPPETIHALFVMCWVYQSLKEVTRLPVQQVQQGRNTGLVSKTLAAIRTGELGPTLT